MDQELIAYLDARFHQTSQQIAGLREELASFRQETSQRFEGVETGLERVETEVRHAHIKIEELHGQVRLLAEGVMSFDERLPIFRQDLEQELENMRTLLRSSYATLDRRTHSLESWRERKERDPIDLIRERYGKTQTSG